MKKIMLLPMLFLFSMWSYGQTTGTIQIGSGTETINGSAAIPVSNYVYNYNQQIITADEYASGGGALGNITKIRYKATSIGTPSVWNDWTVYVGHTTKTEFTSTTDWVPITDLTQVFSGIITPDPVADNWFEITFSAPFNYTGGNIVIAIDENTLGWSSSPTFAAYTSTNNKAIYYRSDSTNPDPASPPAATGRIAKVAQIQLEGVLASCLAPSNLTATIASMTTADISWDASTSAPSSGYEYAVTTSATPPASGTATTGTSVQGVAISQSVENYLHVRANCGGGDLSSWATYMFMGPTPGQIGYLEATGAMPIQSCYAYNYSQQLFYANEVALAGNGNNFITKIRYYYDSAPSSGTANWDNWTVYMAHTSKTEFASDSDWVPGTDLIEVFSGNITIPAAGNWMEIELDNGFLWDGISNLVIAIDENVTSYNCTAYFGTFNDPSEVGRTLLHYSDSVNADPLSPPTANGWYYTVNALQLEATPPPSCLKPTQLAVTATTATTADVSWTVGDTETNWNISWGTPGYTPGDSNEINTGTTSGTPDFQITNLTPLTSYDVYVQADCGSGDLSVWEGPFNFTTAADCSIYTLSITANGDYVCDEGTATLTATASGGGEDIYWYDAAVGGNLLGIGNSFETPYITQTTSYWAAEVVNGGPLAGQANANPTTFSNSTSNSGGLLFTVNNPIVIVDVEVFGTSTTGGDITIELRDIDNGNATIASTTATITGGGTAASPIPHTIPLDFAVPAAGNYRLVRTAATASVGMGYVTAANSSFPYPLGNSGEVTGGATATGTSTSQYFFFNWTIKEAALCESVREEAVATVVTVEEVEASATTTQVDPGNSTTLTATSTNTNYTYAWTWDSTTGGGTGTGTGASITVTPTAHTTYTVTATDSVTGCIAIDEIQIVVFNTALCNPLDITTTTGGYICDEGTVTLTATASGSGDDIYWYDAATGGNLVGKGANFETPELTQTTSYWAAEVLQDIDVPSNTLPTYCTPTFTTGCTSSDTIDDFILEDSTNTVLISHLGTGCSPAGYGDYTGDVSLQADLEAGETYSFSATHGTGSQYVRIWIDFDGNGSFEDAGELVYEATSAASSTVPTVGTFEIPSTISAINTVMRVKTTWSTGVSDSCTQSGSWGEAHDYMVSISSVLNLCESPREEAIATVVTVEAVEASATDTKVDPGNSTTLTATSTNSNYTYAWTWDSTTGGGTGTATGASITVTPSAHTTYTVTATDTVTGCVATDEIEILVFNTALCNTLDIVSVTDGYVCDEGTVTLTATRSNTGDEIYWYDAPTGGNLVGKGASFETPFLTQTTSYWAAEVLEEGGLTSGQGKPTYSSATSGNSTSGSNWGLIFDAYEAFTIQDVEVYSTGGGGDITIQLQDNTGAMIDEVTVTLPGGGSPTSPVAYTAVLNMNVPAPGTYRLVRTTSNPATVNMIRESSSNTYPYPLGTVGSITSGYISGTSNTYYWFYNWTVSTAFPLCESDREEAVATVVTVETVEASATDTKVDPGNSTTLTATSTNSNYTYAWTWDSTTGGGTGTATGASITVTPSAHTTYTVTATDSVTGCVTTDEIEILVFNTALCAPLDIVSVTDGYVCNEGTTILTATPFDTNNEVYWYDAATGGNLVGKGANFETPFLTQTTSYWAAEVLEEGGTLYGLGSTQTGVLNSFSSGGYGLLFTLTEEIVLIDVQVYNTGAAGEFEVDLRDVNDGNTVIATSAPISLPGGGTTTTPILVTVPLNFQIPPGDYRLIARNTSGSPSLGYITSGNLSPGFPFSLGTYGEITGGASTTGTSSSYENFFNWTISTAFALCESTREEAVATVISDAAPVGPANQNFVLGETLADLDVTGTNLTWYDDAAGTNVIPDTTLLVDATTYYVSQTINGCESQLLAITVTEVQPCDAPTNVVVGTLTTTTAEFSWTGSPHETDGYNWVVMEDGDDPLTDTPVDSGTTATGITTATATGLNDDTDYDFYVQTNCGAGNLSTWAGPLNFTTDEDVSVSNIWTVNVQDTGWGDEVSWELRDSNNTVLLSVVDGDYGQGYNDTQSVTTSNEPLTFYIEAMGFFGDNTPTYTVSCSGNVVASGSLAGGDDATHTGLVCGAAPVCLDPSAIVVSAITDSSAAISWTENGTATEWEIEYGLSGFTQGSGTVIVDNDGTLGETLTGLDADEDYDVYVRAICSSTNASAWIGPESFTTLEAPCIDPSAIVISNVSHDSADVSWTENGTATEWEIEYGLSGFTQGSGTVIVDNDGTLGETLAGLDADESYDVYVRAICSSTNASAWIGPESFTTLEAPCVDPSAIVISNVTYDSADVSWTENGTATEWEIEYGLSGFTQGSGTVIVDNDGTLGETITGLDADESYDVYVRAICSSTNASAWVGPESFITGSIGIADHDFSGFAYYPNPMDEVLNISSTNEMYEISIFNILGQKIVTHKMVSNTGTINVSHLASGSYMMQVMSETGQVMYVRLLKE